MNSLKISIGLPVYNGSKFLTKRLDNILSQTFQDFELIISDNASTDSTSEICKKYADKDDRIQYFRQKENMGATWNLKFVLRKAKYDYFVWAGVDDIWKSEFLTKNIHELVTNRKLVGSMGKINFYGFDEHSKSEKIDTKFRTFLKKIRYDLKPGGIYPLSGSYENKIRNFLKKSRMQMIYGIYKKDSLRESFSHDKFVGYDTAIIMNILKKGDFNVVNEVLMDVYTAGVAKTGMINYSRHFNNGILGIVFPMSPLTIWSWNNLGSKLFLKNLDYFVQLNLWGAFSVIVDIIRIFLNNIIKK